MARFTTPDGGTKAPQVLQVGDPYRRLNYRYEKACREMLLLKEAIGPVELLLKERDDLRSLLSTLLYWHDKGGIDESWWDGVRELLDGPKA